MKAQFEDLYITGLNGDLCYPVEGSALRLYLQLSQPPPLGWAYLFSQVWRTVEYSSKPRVGVESGAIWIECTPEAVRREHLAHLEWAIEQTCERYYTQYRQREIALENQRELSRQTHMKLEELARSFAPVEEAAEAEVCELPQPRLGRVADFLRRAFAIPVKGMSERTTATM